MRMHDMLHTKQGKKFSSEKMIFLLKIVKTPPHGEKNPPPLFWGKKLRLRGVGGFFTLNSSVLENWILCVLCAYLHTRLLDSFLSCSLASPVASSSVSTLTVGSVFSLEL
jgi:hypothetical protein